MKSLGLVFSLLVLFALPARMPFAAQPEGAWRAEWEKTVQAAKKEGQLRIYVTEVYQAIFREFGKKYPEINVVAVSGLGGQLAQRIMSERRAEKYLVDFYLGGSDTIYDVFYKGKMLEPVKSMLILPEVADESHWLGKKHAYMDEEGQYIFAFCGITQTYFNYNTKLVNPNEFRSYWDFVDPKWKGKIVVFDPTSLSGPQGALRFLYNNPEIGPKFLRQFLGEMDVTATRDLRQLVDWMAQGRFPLMALQSPDRADLIRAKEQGLPVGWFDASAFKEGAPLSTSNGNMAVFKPAPHPNAAKLALNWFLSREGQMVYQRIARDKDSRRTDIPKDTVLPHVRRVEGARYMMLENPEWRRMSGEVSKLVEEVWQRRK